MMILTYVRRRLGWQTLALGFRKVRAIQYVYRYNNALLHAILSPFVTTYHFHRRTTMVKIMPRHSHSQSRYKIDARALCMTTRAAATMPTPIPTSEVTLV